MTKFDPDVCEEECAEAYYAAEAACKEQHRRNMEKGDLSPEECEANLETCIGLAEIRLDGCIEECRKKLFASLGE